MVLIIFGMVLVVGSKMKPSDGQPINDVLDYEALQVEEDEEDKRND